MDVPAHLGGDWTDDPATRYPALWTWLVDELDVRSVLDVGCGEGLALGHFAALGCVAHGIDGVPRERAGVAVHDFEDGPYLPGRAYDLCWSCEFVEHVEERFVPNFLETFRSSRLLLLTHALPGQLGHHHVNCRPSSYWLRALAGAGFELDEGLTARAREAAAENPAPDNYFVRTGMALRRSS